MGSKSTTAVIPIEKSKGGRPPYQRDDKTARQVEAMTGYGIPVASIARLIGVSENTLRKYYEEELAVGMTKANAKVIESLFRKATGEGQGSVAAAIFWAKTRCGWKETNVTEMTGPDGAPLASGESARERLTVLIQRCSDQAEGLTADQSPCGSDHFSQPARLADPARGSR